MIKDFFFSAMLLGTLSSGEGTPFWMGTNQYGLMPEAGEAVALVQARMPYDSSRDFQWRWGLSMAADTGQKTVLMDECYGSLKWKAVSIDLGMKHRENLFQAADGSLGSLSVTGGHFMDSGNSRAMPGYSLVLDPVAVPWTGGHLAVYGLYGDYLTLDERYVSGAMVHRMQMMARLAFGKFEMHAGLDHYAMWNGVSPSSGEMPDTFGDYLRVITGSHGGAASSQSDRNNVIGNQLGAEVLRLVWNDGRWSLTFQHEIPYEDKSGMKFHNFPDGNNTLHFGFARKDRWVSDIVYEFNYTMNQSGAIHDDEFDADGNPIPWHPGLHFDGRDEYFNNGEFKSGWTYYGRTIGCPLFFPAGTLARTVAGGGASGASGAAGAAGASGASGASGATGASGAAGATGASGAAGAAGASAGITLGVENNRLISHHIGLSGRLFRKHPYRLMLTYSSNYGTYDAAYSDVAAALRTGGTASATASPASPTASTASPTAAGTASAAASPASAPLRQVSGGFTGKFVGLFGIRGLALTYGLYADRGQVLPDLYGATLGLSFCL